MHQKLRDFFVTSIILIAVLLFPDQLECQQSVNIAEVNQVVVGAVENIDWMHAKSEIELNNILAQYFDGYLLEKNTSELWQMIKEPTDWYSVAFVEGLSVVSQSENGVLVRANLKEVNLLDEDTKYGWAIYQLVNTKNNWRIVNAEHHW